MLIGFVVVILVVLGASIRWVTSSANAVGTPGRIAGIARSDEIQDRWISNGSSFGRLPSGPKFRFDDIPEFFPVVGKRNGVIEGFIKRTDGFEVLPSGQVIMKNLDGVLVYGDDGVARTGTFYNGVGFLPLGSPEPGPLNPMKPDYQHR